MKKTLFVFLLFAGFLFFNHISAQEYKTALGVRLSSRSAVVNNSISLKHFLNEKTAIEGLFSFGDPLALGALLEVNKPIAGSGIQWYYGGGGYLAFVKSYNVNKQKNETTTNFGAQGVLGLDYKFANLPLNLSMDWKPELNIVTAINFEPSAIGFTARFTFGK
ncbi:MAG TPA: hypothetical protein VET23_14695 [Chitinophagaceae bacterium]|nr:hypothetical protein [Chitinophagaceae bacterium]